MEIEKKYKKDQILNFKEDDWVWRRSSGYAGYDHKDNPNNESTWIYESDFCARKSLKRKYEEEYKLISDFRTDQLPFGTVPEYMIQEFLNKRFFVESCGHTNLCPSMGLGYNVCECGKMIEI